MLRADIPARFLKYWAQDAGDPNFVHDIPTDSQINITGGAASQQTGFPPLNFTPQDAGGIPPFGNDMNGILRMLAQWAQWMSAGGPLPYNSAFAAATGGYMQGGVVASTTEGKYWRSLVDDNDTDPDSDPTDWASYLGTVPPVSVTTATGITYTNGQVGVEILRSTTNLAVIDTLPGTSPGVLPSGSLVKVTNTNAAALIAFRAGSGATLDGGALNFVTLGPGQSGWFLSDGSNYQTVQRPLRAKLAANTSTTIYVSNVNGNDNFPGITAAQPFLTRQAVWNYMMQNLDIANAVVRVVFDASLGVYTDAMGEFGFAGVMVGQRNPNQITFDGNGVTFSPIGPQATWLAQFGGNFTLANMLIQNGTSHGVECGGPYSAIFNETGIRFGSCGGFHIFSTFMGVVGFSASYAIISGAGGHVAVSQMGNILVGGGITVTITGTPNFSNAFAVAAGVSYIEYQGVTFAGVATGQKYNAALNAVINTGTSNINYLPGNSAGSTSTGGQYA